MEPTPNSDPVPPLNLGSGSTKKKPAPASQHWLDQEYKTVWGLSPGPRKSKFQEKVTIISWPSPFKVLKKNVGLMNVNTVPGLKKEYRSIWLWIPSQGYEVEILLLIDSEKPTYLFLFTCFLTHMLYVIETFVLWLSPDHVWPLGGEGGGSRERSTWQYLSERMGGHYM